MSWGQLIGVIAVGTAGRADCSRSPGPFSVSSRWCWRLPLRLTGSPFARLPFERGDRSDCECRRKVEGEFSLVPVALRLPGCGDRLCRNLDQEFGSEIVGRVVGKTLSQRRMFEGT